ncbi:MAG: hypothetical protein PHW11_09195 [Anaerolineaceae bacterium]|nr:hypothetical protein [Anaerolineaceae bacterium]MDD4043713.1 hypothetical protein [Anaerolineaceae bacterium]MDD4578401.1 hypothetical protein [Anaerolineaceae bacterium]
MEGLVKLGCHARPGGFYVRNGHRPFPCPDITEMAIIGNGLYPFRFSCRAARKGQPCPGEGPCRPGQRDNVAGLTYGKSKLSP